MTHANDGLLQAFLDGEVADPAAAELRDHLTACVACNRELAALERMGSRVHQALALLDAPPPMVRAQAVIAAAQRSSAAPHSRFGGSPQLAGRSLAKAAMLLLALAGAGAAAIPDSPVRRALEGTIARVAQLFGTDEQIAEVPTAPPVVDSRIAGGMGVLPAEGRVQVALQRPAGPVAVTVRLVDTPRALVETATEGQGVRFRSAPGRLEVSGLTRGEVNISIPRSARNATIEIGGQVYAWKQGAALHLTGPAGAESGEQVSFTIGT